MAGKTHIELQRRLRYRKDPIQWMVDKFGVPRHTLVWSENPGYEESGRAKPDPTKSYKPGWGGWDGTPDPIARMLTALAQGKWVGCESATGTGKTFIAAAIACWFLDVFPQSLVISVAGKEDQLRKNLWKEIGRNWDAFKQLREEAEKLDLALYVQAKAKDRDAWGAFGYAAGVGADEDSATRMQGFHAKHMLFIIEEMPGVPDPVVTAIRNTCVGEHNLILGLGNPDSETDALHRFCLRDGVEHIRISAYDHPNVVTGNSDIVPGAVTMRSIVDRLKNDWGNDRQHPLYLSRVRGICPIASGHCLFLPAALEAIKKEHCDLKGREEWIWRKPPEENVVYHLNPYIPRSTDEDKQELTIIHEMPKDDYVDRYILGADVAAGDGDAIDGDWHAALVYDRVDKKFVAMIHMRGDRESYAKELVRVASMYRVSDPRPHRSDNHCLLAWETNNVGSLHLIPEFKKYPRLFRRMNIGVKNVKERRLLGWYTHEPSRKNMVDALRSWGKELTYYPERVPFKRLWNEMKAFCQNKDGKYEAVSGFHDDLVMAAGICLAVDEQMTAKGRLPVKVVRPDRPPVQGDASGFRRPGRKNPKPKTPLNRSAWRVSRMPKSYGG